MSEVIVTDADGLRTIRLNRPEKKNALTKAMYAAMRDAVREGSANPAVRAILLTGGDACFTSGNDVGDFKARSTAEPATVPTPARDFLWAMIECPKPIVAAVAGFAIGIGTTMLLHCDLVYASENALFRMPFVDLGLCPEGGSSLLVPLRAGQLLANELLLLGEAFGPATAVRAGIANAVVAPQDLLAHAESKARTLANKPPEALAATKALLRRPDVGGLRAHMHAEFDRFGELLRGPEAAEAVSAFQEKRKPDFQKFFAKA